jgi:hypothetical protein
MATDEKMIRKSITMPPSMVRRLEDEANRVRRSFSQYVRILIEKAERGDSYPSLPEAPADCDMVDPE